jgi:hypothetical protein
MRKHIDFPGKYLARILCGFVSLSLAANVLAAPSIVPPASTVAYLRSTVAQPWGDNDNDLAMTAVFGAGWQDLRYETVNASALFASSNKFIFLEGGADSGTPMATFLTNNLPAISNWVSAGGSIFINAAPYFGSSFAINLGFGATANVGDFSTNASALIPLHVIFNGPALPVGRTFTGNYVAYSTISGAGLTGLLTNSIDGNFVLAEEKYGAGHLLFGGMTLPSFSAPQPQGSNLLNNILAYGGSLGDIAPGTRVAIYGAPTTPSWNNDVSNKIAGTALFSQVDTYNVGAGQPVPTLAQLQQYGAVLVYPDSDFNDSTALGNVLANYADSGGGVVLAASGFGPSGPLGRFSTGGYAPLSGGSSASGTVLTMVADQPSHPILNGVSSFNGGTSSYHESSLTLSPGTSLVAHWNDGTPLIAARQLPVSRVAGLNFYPPSTDARSDFWPTNTDGAKLLANSLFWSCNGATTNNNSTNGWNGTDYISPFGEPNTANYGETFVAPATSPVLTSFRFYLNNTSGFVTFRFYVMAWDGAKASGPVLYQSPVTTTAGASGMQPYTFNTGQLPLKPGQLYVAFLSTSTVQDGGSAAAGLGAYFPGTYSGGGFVYQSSGTNYSQLTNSGWNTFGGYDAAFVATFSGGALGARSPITVGIPAPSEGVNEYNAIYNTLTNFGFNVVTLSNNNWSGINVVVSYPGGAVSFGPSLAQITNGFSTVQISDWGPDWTSQSFASVIKGTNLTISLGAAHPITAGLPASWTAHGYWHYDPFSSEYVSYSTDATLPNLASETAVTGASGVLTARTFDRGRAVYIGWNIFGPDAGGYDLAVFYNSILWAAQASPSVNITTQSKTSGNFGLTWDSVAGYVYQAQYCSNLTQGAWLNFGSPITAIGPLTTTSGSVTNPVGFYRAQLLP